MAFKWTNIYRQRKTNAGRSRFEAKKHRGHFFCFDGMDAFEEVYYTEENVIFLETKQNTPQT